MPLPCVSYQSITTLHPTYIHIVTFIYICGEYKEESDTGLALADSLYPQDLSNLCCLVQVILTVYVSPLGMG